MVRFAPCVLIIMCCVSACWRIAPSSGANDDTGEPTDTGIGTPTDTGGMESAHEETDTGTQTPTDSEVVDSGHERPTGNDDTEKNDVGY